MKKTLSPFLALLCFFALTAPFFAGCSKKTPPARTAEKVVEDVAQQISAQKPQVLWEALPPSYRKDVEDIVHELAGKMDKELWNRGFGLSGKVLAVLKAKKDLLLAGKLFGDSSVDAAKLSDNWDAVVGLAEIIAKSELADLEKLKRLDVNKFLTGTGASLMGKLNDLSKIDRDEKIRTAFDRLKGVKTTLVRSQKDAAVVKIEIPGEVSWEMPFVKVEGKWIPKTLADQWKTKINEARKELDGFSASLSAEEKQRALGMMTSIDGILEQMLAAKTVKDLESAMGQAFGMILGMALGKG